MCLSLPLVKRGDRWFTSRTVWSFSAKCQSSRWAWEVFLPSTSTCDVCPHLHTHIHFSFSHFFSALVLCVVSDCSGLSHQRWLRLLASSVIVPTLDFVYTSSWWRGFMSKLWWNRFCSEGRIYYFRLLLFSRLAEFSQRPSLLWSRRYNNICWRH